MTVPAHQKGESGRGWDIATRLLIPVVIAAGAMLVAHEVRLGRIEGNRFTDRDANELERRMRLDYPPQWLRDSVDEIKQLIRDQDVRLRAIEAKVK